MITTFLFEKGREVEAAAELLVRWCKDQGMENPDMYFDIKYGNYEAVYLLHFKRIDQTMLEEVKETLTGPKEGEQKKDQDPEGPGP